MRLIADKYLVRRMVHNLPAPSRAGKPVHDDFNCPHGTGAVHFARLLNEHLAAHYPDWAASLMPLAGRDSHSAEIWPSYRPELVRGWCDPAATYGGDEHSAARPTALGASWSATTPGSAFGRRRPTTRPTGARACAGC